MWIPLKTEVSDRFAAVEAFFKAAHKHNLEQTSKGIAFVQAYAAYEFTVRAAVRTAVDSITSQRHRNHELIPSLMALFLDPELTSLRDCGGAKVWLSRIELFQKLFSRAHASVHNTVFPIDGSHFRHKQLETVFAIFGIKRMPAQRSRHLLRIDEVVGNRNDIAHGHLAADSVGSRYSRKEVLQMIQQMRSVCLLLISALQKQCVDKKRHCRTP